MAIDIQGLPGGLVQNTGDSASAAQARPQQRAPGVEVASADTVSITDSASRLRNIESTLNNLPVADAQRVEGVQRQLATGTYAVDPVSSADKMLEIERNLPDPGVASV